MPADKVSCYASVLAGRYAGLPGWPKTFGEPIYKPAIMEQALRWKDLTGTKRPDKPWLDGMPRVIFLNDLGDSFTPSAPLLPPTAIGGMGWIERHWLTDWLSKMAESPHIWLLLTKQPKRMREFFDRFKCPDNVWCGTSVIDNAMANRNLPELMATKAKMKWISYEPAREFVNLIPFIGHNAYHCKCGWHETEHAIYPQGHDAATQSPQRALCVRCGEDAGVHLAASLVVIGGESRQGKMEPQPLNIKWARNTISDCKEASVACFLKQLGSNPWMLQDEMGGKSRGMELTPLKLKDSHGGNMSEWPRDLQVREMPWK